MCEGCGKAKARLCQNCATYHPPAWTPFERAYVNRSDPVAAFAFEGCEVFRNSRYQVALRECGTGAFGPMIHLSIKRIDKEPIRDWRDFQRIKNELAGPQAEAVEIFPAEARLVDGANQYHLWVFHSYRFPFGFSEGRQISEGPADGGKQRPFEDEPLDLKEGTERIRNLIRRLRNGPPPGRLDGGK